MPAQPVTLNARSVHGTRKLRPRCRRNRTDSFPVGRAVAGAESTHVRSESTNVEPRMSWADMSGDPRDIPHPPGPPPAQASPAASEPTVEASSVGMTDTASPRQYHSHWEEVNAEGRDREHVVLETLAKRIRDSERMRKDVMADPTCDEPTRRQRLRQIWACDILTTTCRLDRKGRVCSAGGL